MAVKTMPLETMTFKTLEEAVEELRHHPENTVRADCGDLAVELRAVRHPSSPQRLGDALASLGPWAGESREALSARLREARQAGGSEEPPKL